MDRKKKTTITLPKRIRLKLAGHQISANRLAVLCIKMAISRQRKMTFNKRPTVRYNEELCSERLAIWLLPEEHYYLKTLRLVNARSVSSLVAYSIEKFIALIISMTMDSSDSKQNWKSRLELSLTHIHREIPVCSKTLSRIVLLLIRPG